jgi:hypothetical protein
MLHSLLQCARFTNTSLKWPHIGVCYVKPNPVEQRNTFPRAIYLVYMQMRLQPSIKPSSN